MIKIIADTTSGLSLELARQHCITLIPQNVIFGDKAYHDDTEIDTATFIQKLRGSRLLPKTAAPEPILYYPHFRAAAQTGDTLIIVAPSARVSGTVGSAQAAQIDFPEVDIRIVDTNTIAGNLATLSLLAAQWAQANTDADTIVARLNNLAQKQHTYFVLDTLEYLAKGGRIGGAKALLGELLQVKPILQIKDGQVQPYDQERTKKHATAKMIEVVCEQAQGSPDPHLCVMEADARAEAEVLQAELGRRLAIQEIPIYALPPAIVVHAGPQALAVGFFT